VKDTQVPEYVGKSGVRGFGGVNEGGGIDRRMERAHVEGARLQSDEHSKPLLPAPVSEPRSQHGCTVGGGGFLRYSVTLGVTALQSALHRYM
jgi:hypothetical protein